MVTKKFLYPAVLYFSAIVMLVGGIVLSSESGSICIGRNEGSVPINLMIVSLHWLFFVRVVEKIDPKYRRIREANFFTVLFLCTFIIISSLGLNFFSPIFYGTFC
jgi:L-lactate utilization protein LutB